MVKITRKKIDNYSICESLFSELFVSILTLGWVRYDELLICAHMQLYIVVTIWL